MKAAINRRFQENKLAFKNIEKHNVRVFLKGKFRTSWRRSGHPGPTVLRLSRGKGKTTVTLRNQRKNLKADVLTVVTTGVPRRELGVGWVNGYSALAAKALSSRHSWHRTGMAFVTGEVMGANRALGSCIELRKGIKKGPKRNRITTIMYRSGKCGTTITKVPFFTGFQNFYRGHALGQVGRDSNTGLILKGSKKISKISK